MATPLAEGLTDEALMRAVQRGDRAAFDALHARWKAPIWAFLLRRFGQREAAEECFQEVWIRLWRHRARYDARRAFRPWLYTIAANLHRNHRGRADEALFELAGSARDRVADRDHLLKVLDTLEGTDRDVILLTAEGFSSAEIAEMIQSTSDAVRARQTRIRRRLRFAFGGGR